MSKDDTQLPKTAFSVKASLPIKEPEIVKKWEQDKIFKNLEGILKEKKNLFYMTDLRTRMDIYIWVRLLIRF